MLFVKGLYGNNFIPHISVSKCTKMPFYSVVANSGEIRKKIKKLSAKAV